MSRVRDARRRIDELRRLLEAIRLLIHELRRLVWAIVTTLALLIAVAAHGFHIA